MNQRINNIIYYLSMCLFIFKGLSHRLELLLKQRSEVEGLRSLLLKLQSEEEEVSKLWAKYVHEFKMNLFIILIIIISIIVTIFYLYTKVDEDDINSGSDNESDYHNEVSATNGE